MNSCLEPEFKVDKDNGGWVSTEAETELVELLRVSDVAGQTKATRRRAPEQKLQVCGYLLSGSPTDSLSLPK